MRQSAFMVVPSGPGLATIGKDQRYTKAVQNCDFAIPDSGYMVLLLRWLKGKKIRIEGYLEELSLSRKEADELIMSAREIVYK